MKIALLGIICAVYSIQVCYAASASGIARYAREQIGSRKWTVESSHQTGRNTFKCNIFVADVLKHERAYAPNRWPFFYSPIGADQWADPDSRYLKDSDYWNLCSGRPQTGDVIAEHGHVGIVTGYRRTTSASARTDPMGIVVENDWGFRSGNNPTCWRYNYSKLPRTPMSI